MLLWLGGSAGLSSTTSCQRGAGGLYCVQGKGLRPNEGASNRRRRALDRCPMVHGRFGSISASFCQLLVAHISRCISAPVFSLKAWGAGCGGATLCWELRRALPMAGFVERSHNTTVCRVFHQQGVVWRRLAQRHGWDIGSCIGASVHSHACSANRRKLGEADLEQEYWVDAKTMLARLADWSLRREGVSARKRCEIAVVAILQHAVQVGMLGEFAVDPAAEDSMLRERGCFVADQTSLCMIAFDDAVRTAQGGGARRHMTS